MTPLKILLWRFNPTLDWHRFEDEDEILWQFQLPTKLVNHYRPKGWIDLYSPNQIEIQHAFSDDFAEWLNTLHGTFAGLRALDEDGGVVIIFNNTDDAMFYKLRWNEG